MRAGAELLQLLSPAALSAVPRQCPGHVAGGRAGAALPVPSCHGVFPLPPARNPLVRVNPRALYNLLFQAAAQTLQAFARAPHHRGAEIGITAVLHTWGQTLTEHVQVHCVVTGGGLALAGSQWRSSRQRFLFAVTALRKVFRGKYLAGLTHLRAQHQLHFVGASAGLAADTAWAAFLSQLPRTPWVAYSQPPCGGPEQGLKYLSRSTPRVAISNQPLVFVGDGVVRWRSKEYAAGGTTKVRELRAEEFLRRVLLPVVPPHCVRIRHCGLVANRARSDKLARCRQLLAVAAAAAVAALPTRKAEPAGQLALRLPPQPSARPAGAVACALSSAGLPNEGSPPGPQAGLPDLAVSTPHRP